MDTTNRINYLDSIRGLAALTVVVFHCISNQWGYLTTAKISFLFFNGLDAVSLFFVLSGLVLTLQLKDIPQFSATDYKQFILKRIFRIYPAYWFCFLFYYLYAIKDLSAAAILKDVFTNQSYWLQEFLLIRENHNLYTPGWSLGVEIAMSAFLPFFILLYQYNKKLFSVFVVVAIILNKNYISIYTLHFCLGIAIAYNYKAIQAYHFQDSKYYKYRYLLVALIFVLYNLRHLLSLLNETNFYDAIANVLYLDEFIFSGLAAAGILVICINNDKIQQVLSNKILVFIGKISYSIYLTHWFFITALLDNWNFFYPYFKNEFYLLLFFTIVTLVATILVSIPLYYFVEKPAILYAKGIFAR